LPRVEVRGRVVFPNDTESRLIVTFTSEGSDTQRRYHATCLRDRHFKLMCPRGSYKATLAYVPGAVGNAGPGPTEKPRQGGAIPSRYQDAKDSPWIVHVSGGGRSDVILVVE